jgi:BA14K-like protein
MIKLGKAIAAACLPALLSTPLSPVLGTLLGASTAQAQDLGVRPLRYGNTSGWFYDNRDDDRDVPTNGFFPGNFTSDPSTAWLGAAGVLAGNSYRSPLPYPSQVVIGPSPYLNGCAQRYRSYDPASGTYVGKDGLRHRC